MSPARPSPRAPAGSRRAVDERKPRSALDRRLAHLQQLLARVLAAEQAQEGARRVLDTALDVFLVRDELEELVARVQVALRRAGLGGSASRMVVGDLSLDLDSRRVWRGEVEAHLTATEFNLLRVLMANAGRVVTREQILDSVWQYDFNGESSIIESFIRNLRKKVDFTEPKLIHTVRGVGYSIREP